MRITKYGVELVREDSKNYKLIKDRSIDSSDDVKKFIELDILNIKKWNCEKFGMICLDNRNNIIGLHILTEGDINQCAVYTKQVCTRALLNNSCKVIVFHNHPAGTKKSSMQDRNLIKKIKAGLNTIEIELLDSLIIIVNDDNEIEVTSMAENGEV